MVRFRVTTPVRVVLASLVLLSSLPWGCRPASASAAATADAPPVDAPPVDSLREGVLVTGTGEVSGRPDTLTAELAVEVTAPAVGQAMDRADVAATRMRDALVRNGIARADLQTSNVSIVAKANDAQAIVGYTASQGLTAKIRDLPRAGQLMSAAIAAGGDAARLNGVSFTIENATALLAEARRNAFADARRKAELYAREAGRPLGRVRTVNETAPGGGGPVGMYGVAAMDARLPIEPGRQRLTVTVTVEWSFGPAPKPSA